MQWLALNFCPARAIETAHCHVLLYVHDVGVLFFLEVFLIYTKQQLVFATYKELLNKDLSISDCSVITALLFLKINMSTSHAAISRRYFTL